MKRIVLFSTLLFIINEFIYCQTDLFVSYGGSLKVQGVNYPKVIETGWLGQGDGLNIYVPGNGYNDQFPRISINHNGYVGINNPNPNTNLSLGSNGGAKFYIYDNGDQQITQGFGVDLGGGPYESNWFGSAGPTNQGYLSLGFRANTIGGGAYSEKMRITANGYIGIGVATPNAKLDLGSGYGSNGEKFLIYNDNTSGALEGTKVGFYMDRFSLSNNSTFVFPTIAGAPGSFIIASKNTANTTLVPRMTVLGENGFVGINTISPHYELDVKGTIRAREIKVDLNGADFVFEKDYKLMSLNELEKFVNEKKHLPEIAPASEMEKNGTDLGNLNSKLLQKVEELTLYTIEQNKRIIELEKQNARIEQQNQELQMMKEKIAKLESALK